MNRNWLMVLVAGLFEIGWVAGLKHASTALEWTGTVVAIFFSFYLLILSARKLPVGTVYAVFAGIGTGGTVFNEIVIFGEPVNMLKLVLIGVLLCGVVGLKLITKEDGDDGTSSDETNRSVQPGDTMGADQKRPDVEPEQSSSAGDRPGEVKEAEEIGQTEERHEGKEPVLGGAGS